VDQGRIRDLTEARAYVEFDDPSAAQRLAERILNAIDEVSTFPRIGKTGRKRGTHEFPVPSTQYIIIYRVKNTVLQILRVYHGRRKWPITR